MPEVTEKVRRARANSAGENIWSDGKGLMLGKHGSEGYAPLQDAVEAAEFVEEHDAVEKVRVGDILVQERNNKGDGNNPIFITSVETGYSQNTNAGELRALADLF